MPVNTSPVLIFEFIPHIISVYKLSPIIIILFLFFYISIYYHISLNPKLDGLPIQIG